MTTNDTEFGEGSKDVDREVATTRDVSEGGVIGAVGGAIVGGFAGGPVGAIVGAVAGAVASSAAVDIVDTLIHEPGGKVGATTHVDIIDWEPEMANPVDTVAIDQSVEPEVRDYPSTYISTDHSDIPHSDPKSDVAGASLINGRQPEDLD